MSWHGIGGAAWYRPFLSRNKSLFYSVFLSHLDRPGAMPRSLLRAAQVPTLHAQAPGHNAQVPTFGGFLGRRAMRTRK